MAFIFSDSPGALANQRLVTDRMKKLSTKTKSKSGGETWEEKTVRKMFSHSKEFEKTLPTNMKWSNPEYVLKKNADESKRN